MYAGTIKNTIAIERFMQSVIMVFFPFKDNKNIRNLYKYIQSELFIDAYVVTCANICI